MSAPNSNFYEDLPVNRIALGDLLLQKRSFRQVPRDWLVVITDIKGSTHAIQEGKHEEVNLIATGSIVSVLNIAFRAGITIPFFFGGDGATFIVPPFILDKVMQAFALYRANTLHNFGLELRTGRVAVGDLYDQGQLLPIAKFGISGSFSIPVVLGNGLNYAERLIKRSDPGVRLFIQSGEEPDLSGMECRWDKISPPKNKAEVVTLLVAAKINARQAEAFSRVINEIDRLYGPLQMRQPIAIPQLKTKTSFKRLSSEMLVKLGRIKWPALLSNWVYAVYRGIYFRTANGKNYLNKLVEMLDTLVIDGKINTVISGTTEQRKALEQILAAMEDAGDIVYGMHVSNASIMSCYVRDRGEEHIHFVDGSEGGYTKAAKTLKTKLAAAYSL